MCTKVYGESRFFWAPRAPSRFLQGGMAKRGLVAQTSPRGSSFGKRPLREARSLLVWPTRMGRIEEVVLLCERYRFTSD